MTLRRLTICAALAVAAAIPLRAQDRGAAHVHALVNGLTVTPRVLIIGAGPADADADLIAWLAKGRMVQTGYLSLTRGESRPNFTGVESGASLGAIHVAEMLAARKLDGGEQYFTRAYDVGSTRSADAAFALWDHNELLGDVVTIVRSFRPHVIVARFTPDTSDHDGQHQVSAVIAREVFDAALDTARYGSAKYGLPWSPLKLYEPGIGLTIDAREYDPLRGASYSDLAVESRSQLRSLGFETAPWEQTGIVRLRRVASRAGEQATGDASIFDGIDTSFARLQAGAPPEAARTILTLLATADSARLLLDAENPMGVVALLGRTYELASSTRKNLPTCGHPSRDLATSAGSRYRRCDTRWLDLDASIDRIQRRAADAALAAAGISFEAVADREFLASGDTARLVVTVFNHGDSAVSVNDVTVSGAAPVRMTEALHVPAHGTARLDRSVVTLAYAHPWWIWKRENNFYPSSTTPLDAVARSEPMPKDWMTNSIAIAEDMRRLSDVSATVTLARTTVSASVGPILFRSADPVLGVRARAVSGVPAVTLGFERSLEWAQAGKPLKKQIRLAAKSFSDRAQKFALKPAMAGGVVRIDSLPSSITLAPREWRETSILLRGTPEQKRYELGMYGATPRDTFSAGFRTAQYSYLPPLHFFRGSAVYVQGVDIEIPARLSVAYVRGAGDDTDVALKQIGIPAYTVNNEGLLRFDLDGISTIVIGPDAFRLDPALLGQVPRLTEFVRKGGTLVMMSNPQAALQPGVLPFPVAFATPVAEQVATESAPVTPIDQRVRLLTWPNTIRADDWTSWAGARALSVPTTVDPRYTKVVEMHDANEKENRNTILVASLGKGRVIYTTITFPQQIANGVPGAMRLFVNLLSASLPADGRVANSGP
jgi:LmbE family N-acetylglucosaminyl deacetylase